MISLTVLTDTSDPRQIDAKPGLTLMEALRDGGVDELLAVCGGCCSCATCHVYIDPEFISALPPVDESEEALLDSLDNRAATSRLSCQIKLTETLSGMTLRVAPEE